MHTHKHTHIAGKPDNFVFTVMRSLALFLTDAVTYIYISIDEGKSWLHASLTKDLKNALKESREVMSLLYFNNNSCRFPQLY